MHQGTNCVEFFRFISFRGGVDFLLSKCLFRKVFFESVKHLLILLRQKLPLCPNFWQYIGAVITRYIQRTRTNICLTFIVAFCCLLVFYIKNVLFTSGPTKNLYRYCNLFLEKQKPNTFLIVVFNCQISANFWNQKNKFKGTFTTSMFVESFSYFENILVKLS